MPVNTVDVANQVVILGAGPAGLTAAYELSNLGLPCVVLEHGQGSGVDWLALSSTTSFCF